LWRGHRSCRETVRLRLNPEGLNEIERATVGYGLANRHLYNGHPARAGELFQRIASGQ
jgi:hypothetical protein